ncbi:hypothetical protein ACYZTX_28945 [Pseudomonas sp. MDT1-17]
MTDSEGVDIRVFAICVAFTLDKTITNNAMEIYLMERITKFMAIIGLAYLLLTCGHVPRLSIAGSEDAGGYSLSVLTPAPSISFNQVKHIAPAFNATGEPTVFVLLSSDDQTLLDVYLLRSAIKEGYSVQSHRSDRPEIELRAQWKGRRFSQSAEHPTIVNLTIQSITPTEAVIDVSGTLVNLATGAYLSVFSTGIRVSGEDLKTLVGEF